MAANDVFPILWTTSAFKFAATWKPSGALQLVLSFPSFGLLVVVPYTYFHPRISFHIWKSVSDPSPSPLLLASTCRLVYCQSLFPNGSFVHALPLPRTRPPSHCSALVYHHWERRGRSSTEWLWNSFSSKKHPTSKKCCPLQPTAELLSIHNDCNMTMPSVFTIPDDVEMGVVRL
jgi:hypothetical protein